MATLFSDSFNRADNATVDATNWQENGGWAIATNRARSDGTSGTPPVTLLTTTSAHAATADCKVSATQVSASASDGGPVARWVAGSSGATSQGYAVDSYTSGGDKCEIYRHDVAASGTLLRTASITRVANAVLRIEVTGTGATVTVKQFYNGVQQGADVSDGSASRITAANRTGIFSWVNGATTDSDYDDFLAEDFASAAVTVSARPQSRPFPFAPGSPR